MAKRAPVIGITTYGPQELEGESGLQFVSLPVCYLEGVADAGGVPVLLAPTSQDPDRVLDGLDGLILAGGGDMTPEHNATGGHQTLYGMVERRDAFEVALARAALARRDLPVLGICRGLQVMNVVTGGDLILHIPDARGEQLLHREPPREPTYHDVTVTEDSLLDAIYGGERTFPVLSWHHQEVGRLGTSCEAIAHAPDGCIEGLVYRDHPWAVAVQWHPEMQIRDDALQRQPFAALVVRARS